MTEGVAAAPEVDGRSREHSISGRKVLLPHQKLTEGLVDALEVDAVPSKYLKLTEGAAAAPEVLQAHWKSRRHTRNSATAPEVPLLH